MSTVTLGRGNGRRLASNAGWFWQAIERLIEARTLKAARDIGRHLARYSDERLKQLGVSHQRIRDLRNKGAR